MEGTFLGTFPRTLSQFHLMLVLSTVCMATPHPVGLRWEHLPCITPLEWETQEEGPELACGACSSVPVTMGCVVQFREGLADLCWLCRHQVSQL
jgi:hypothetical protein